MSKNEARALRVEDFDRRDFWQQPWVRPLATMIFVVILATLFSPREGDSFFSYPIFWRPANLASVLRQISDTGILAMGMTLVILSAGIDLSVGAVLALSGTIFASTFAAKGWHPAASIAAALAAATLCGLVNGALITRLRLQPFIATLATMIGARGFAKWLVNNATIALGYDDHTRSVVSFMAQKGFVVSSFLVVTLLGYVMLNRLQFGRHVMALGGSESAARLSGIPVSWVKLRVYLFAGFVAGVAGVLNACEVHQGSANAGVGYELDAIAAAVIGGTSLAGGRGSIFGTLMGALALGILSNLLGLRNVDENVQWMLKAVIMIAAVWIQTIGTKKQAA